MKKNVIYAAAASLLLGLAACSDELNGDDRFMANPNPPEVTTKRFIVEDFTGQLCINCPVAAEMLSGLKEDNYGDNMILVAMHAGGLSLGTPLHNDVAQSYMDALGLKNNPAISIDRQYSDDGVYTNWGNPIAERAMATAPCEITPTVVQTGNRKFKVVADVDFLSTVAGGSGDDAVRLGVQHWVVQDSIVSPQITPTGLEASYLHNHVFRGCMYENIWGTELAKYGDDYEEGERYTSLLSDEFTIPEDWDIDDMSIVSFVFHYSDDEANPIGEIIQANMVKLDLK